MVTDRLRDLRAKAGKTQKDLAKMLGITRQGYGNYENGITEPDNETLQKLAEYFNTTTDYLLGRTNNPEQTVITTDEQKNIAFFGGRKEELSDEEAAHLEESLELFRLLKAKRMAEKNKEK